MQKKATFTAIDAANQREQLKEMGQNDSKKLIVVSNVEIEKLSVQCSEKH